MRRDTVEYYFHFLLRILDESVLTTREKMCALSDVRNMILYQEKKKEEECAVCGNGGTYASHHVIVGIDQHGAPILGSIGGGGGGASSTAGGVGSNVQVWTAPVQPTETPHMAIETLSCPDHWVNPANNRCKSCGKGE